MKIALCIISIALFLPVARGQNDPNRAAEIQRRIANISKTSVAVISAVPSQVNASHKVVYQYGIATVVVGSSPNGLPVGYRLMLLPTVQTDIEEADEVRLRRVVAGMVEPIATRLRVDIDALPGLGEPGATSIPPGDDVHQHFEDYEAQTEDRTHAIFSEAVAEFNVKFSQLFPKYASTSFLAIGLRPCVGSTCEVPDRPRNRSTDRFGKLYTWMKSRGLTIPDQAYILNSEGSFWSITARLDHGYEWQEDFPKDVLQAALVISANRARRNQIPISYSAAELAGLSKELTAHLADVFDSAYAAGIDLPSDANAQLQGISDELGRARLTECVRLRGAFDPSEAGQCAGFNLTPSIISSCLSGGECMPNFGGQVNLDSLSVIPHATLAYLAQNADLPRVNLGTIDRVAGAVDQCKSASAGDAGFCILTNTVGSDPRTADTLKCVQGLARDGTGSLVNCVLSGTRPDQRAQIACFQNNSKNYANLALCAEGQSLPPVAVKYVQCASSFDHTDNGYQQAAACFGAAAGSREAACLVQHDGDWQNAALCVAGDRVPPQVQGAIHCAENSQSLGAFGVCMVANETGGEAQRIAACYVEGQGVPTAVAICLAGQFLTQDQRIVLECAAQTGGVVPATAICAGGKLTMKEMVNCRGKNFGEGNCFSDSNEIRKLAKSLGIEIGPHSVVADVVNIQLRIWDLTTTPILEAGAQGVATLMKVANDNNLIPDPQHPRTFITTSTAPGPIGHVLSNVLDNYCDHNWCP